VNPAQLLNGKQSRESITKIKKYTSTTKIKITNPNNRYCRIKSIYIPSYRQNKSNMLMANPEIPSAILKTGTSNKEALIWMGELAIIHTSGKETNGRYSLVELFATKEGEVPWHIHHKEDEGFYILEGEVTLYIGEQVIKGKPGDYIFAPLGIPHKYSVDSPGHVRMLMVFSPAGFEGFIRETSVPATSLTPPDPETIEIDIEKIIPIAEAYGAEFVDGPSS
jgi:quercetin dioxygenase-like cupin family protein